jgi:hypothetical protein
MGAGNANRSPYTKETHLYCQHGLSPKPSFGHGLYMSLGLHWRLSTSLGMFVLIACLLGGRHVDASEGATVSFSKDIYPILQANCMGCHQPAKKQGGYLMTDF